MLDGIDMQAIYMASTRSPLCGPQRGRFKLPQTSRYAHIDVLSQVVEDDDSDYEQDSFCCDDDDELERGKFGTF